MPMRGKLGAKPTPSRKPGTPEETMPKFRAKILGLSSVAEQNAMQPADREELGDASDAREVIARLEQELARRQESYVRRERQYEVRISELEAQLQESRSKKSKGSNVDASMEHLRQMHRSVMDSVEQVQERTSKILQEQEKDLLRAFRARLYSVQEELESEKNKTDDGASAWIEKSKQLETEVEWTKELADRLDRLNQSLTRENQRLKTQFATQENDREFLVKQLVTVKKDNVRLRNEYEELRRQMEAIQEDTQQMQDFASSHPHQGVMGASLSAGVLPHVRQNGSCGVSGSNHALSRPSTVGVVDSDHRYKEIIKRLKRLLETERRNLQQVRTAYKQEMQNRTELEGILKECIQDVRAEIVQHSQLPPVTPTSSISLASPHANGSTTMGSPAQTRTLLPSAVEANRLNVMERQRLIEKLLTKERLLNLLTTRAFPLRNGKQLGDPLHTGDALSPEEMARMVADVTSGSTST